MADSDKLTLIANVAASYLRRNSLDIDQIPAVVSSITEALEQAGKKLNGTIPDQPVEIPSAEEKPRPFTSIKKSVQHDHITCLEDGFQGKTLKRHLQTAHGLTPRQYRDRWQLPRDYPIVAPAYSAQRSKMAKQLGLGRKAAAAKAGGAKRRGRKATNGNGVSRPA
jgi:predicted transcriptional regulator